MAQESLRNILNKNINDHKAEIRHIAKSSLSSLKTSSDSKSNLKWKTSTFDTTNKNSNKKYKNNFQISTEDDFSDRMFLFSLGSDEVIDKVDIAKPMKKPVQLKSLDSTCKINDLQFDRLNDNKSANNDLPIDNNRSPEKFNFTSPRYLTREDRIGSPKANEENQKKHQELLPHYIHPSYKTRYVELLRFRNENVREKDEFEQEMLSGSHLVIHLKNRLKMKLENMQSLGRTPNFHRLQVYSEIFDDLIAESWMFGPVFAKIKTAYDSEVDRVLGMPVSQKELLQSEMDQLRQSIYHKEKLDNIQSEIVQIEEAISMAMETEKEYDNLLIIEEEKLESLIEMKSKIDDEKRKSFKPEIVTTVPTESEKVELLKSQCWDIMDEISKIQKETKEHMTSRASVIHLREGLQDTGIEVEKLNYHNNLLQLEVDELTRELDSFLENDADISIEDYKSIKSLLNGSTILPPIEYEESNKWSWYIS